MIVVRNVFQAKYGKGNDLVALIREANKLWPTRGQNFRILTDLSGQFFTVVTEVDIENLAAFEAASQATFSDERFPAWFERMTQLVEGGRREFYTIAD